jgi:hypothetical protein
MRRGRKAASMRVLRAARICSRPRPGGDDEGDEADDARRFDALRRDPERAVDDALDRVEMES